MAGEAPSAPEEIEVGAADGELRLWKAKEALRHGESRLAAQTQSRTAMEARATATTGWASASLLALAAAGFSAPGVVPKLAATAAAAPFLAAAGMCIAAIRPRDWAVVGFDPQEIIDDPLGSELEILESAAKGLSAGIRANNRRLDSTGRLLRYAGWMMISAPLLGVITYAIGLAAT